MIYLDNAATTRKKPACVVEAVTEALCNMGNAGRGSHNTSLGAARTVFYAREKVCELFNGESPSQVAFTANVTESLNIVIKGILEPGDHVITTTLEHNSVLRPLFEMEDRGVELTILPSDEKGRIDYDNIAKEIKDNTKAIICTHGSNLTGNRVDIKKVGQIAKENNLLFVVDASQTAGVFDIDVKDMQIDILCFTGHKGLLGPQGTGGILVKEGVTIKPLLSGGSGIKTYSRTHPSEMPTALEAGTLNAHGLAGLAAAIEYLQETGLENIRAKEQALMKQFYNGVKDVPGVTIYGDFDSMDRCAIVTLNIWDYDSGEVSDALAFHKDIHTRPGGHCAPLMHQALGTVEQGAVRFSFSHENTPEEVEVAIAAIKELAERDE